MNRRSFFKGLVFAPLLALLPKAKAKKSVVIGDSVAYTGWTATDSVLENCLIRNRGDQEGPLFTFGPDGTTVNLVGYAIIPLEELDKKTYRKFMRT